MDKYELQITIPDKSSSGYYKETFSTQKSTTERVLEILKEGYISSWKEGFIWYPKERIKEITVVGPDLDINPKGRWINIS